MNRTGYMIGLMSGTSLDGLDIVYVRFLPDYDFEIIHVETYPYTDKWRSGLKDAVNLNSQDLLELDVAYGEYLGNEVNRFMQKYNIEKVDAVASHGHTVFHQPNRKFTLQIGHGAAISAVTQRTVVCDFRSQDVILGGQGAPLVPIGDELLFGKYDACLNLGGFSNISMKRENKRIAFDICPVNIVLNKLANRLDLEYDKNGEIAKSGKIIQPLLDELNNLAYYRQDPPKSLGFEWCVENIYPKLERYFVQDLLATFTQHVAFQIIETIQKYNINNLFITGGGTGNTYLIDMLKAGSQAELIIPGEKIIDFKEALIFAYLGKLRLEDKINVLSSVTGAKKDHCSGVVYTLINRL